MSMPKIISSSIERKQAISDIIESVALEETALSHILNAEGEKIQAIVNDENSSVEDMLLVNNSVKKMVQSISKLELLLTGKLSTFQNALLLENRYGFSFTKKDSETGKWIKGAIFELKSNGVSVAVSESNEYGTVKFSGLALGEYTLEEIKPADKYLTNTDIYQVIIKSEFDITIDGVPSGLFIVYNTPYPTITVFNYDQVSNPLFGSLFELKGNGFLQYLDTDINGHAYFEKIAPGIYNIKQISAPQGYKKDDGVRGVVIAEDGSMIIGGVPTNTLRIQNNRI